LRWPNASETFSKDQRMGAKRWILVALSIAAYFAPSYACPYPAPEPFNLFCETVRTPIAGLTYKLYSTAWMILVVLASFDNTPAPIRLRIALLVASISLPISLTMHWPYFLWRSLTNDHVDIMRSHYSIILASFIIWTIFHRALARWPWLWRNLDPRNQAPASDRRRAIFWHPATALVFHQLAATTNLWVLK